MRVLAVVAHPDDEVYTVGGTLAKLANDENDVHVLIVTEGCSSQYDDIVAMIAQKREESQKVAKIFGLESSDFRSLPDMKLDTLSHVDLNRIIEKQVKRIQPELVFTHHPGDLNLDHRLVSHSTLIATRSPSIKTIAYIQGAPGNHDFKPNWYVELPRWAVEKKQMAVEAYQSELRPFPHSRNIEAALAQVRTHGVEIGVPAAEAFEIYRRIT